MSVCVCVECLCSMRTCVGVCCGSAYIVPYKDLFYACKFLTV